MKRMLIAALSALFILALAVPAFAAVTFDAETGTGFVGKGDVQTALNLNNAGLQTGTFAFAYADEVTLSQSCERTAGNSEVITQTRTRTRTVDSDVAYEARKNSQGQITGFNLTGYENGDGGFVLPADICPAPDDNPNDPWKPVTGVTVIGSTGGVLTVNGVALQ